MAWFAQRQQFAGVAPHLGPAGVRTNGEQAAGELKARCNGELPLSPTGRLAEVRRNERVGRDHPSFSDPEVINSFNTVSRACW